MVETVSHVGNIELPSPCLPSWTPTLMETTPLFQSIAKCLAQSDFICIYIIYALTPLLLVMWYREGKAGGQVLSQGPGGDGAEV